LRFGQREFRSSGSFAARFNSVQPNACLGFRPRLGYLYVNYTTYPHFVSSTHLKIAFTYVIPIGMIQAITSQQIGLKYVAKAYIPFSPDLTI
jgi:hypothetical protein